MKHNLFYYFHLLLVICVIFTVFTPLYLLKYLFIIPFLIYCIWMIFDDCPINRLHRNTNNKKDNFFIYDVLKNFNKDLKEQRAHIITGFVSVALVTISAFRFLYRI